MKKMFTRFFFLALVSLLFSATGFSQTAYRSISSGDWDNFAIWERTTNVYNPSPTWAPAVSGQVPTSNNIVYVRNGHTVTTGATKSCLNLIIETGGTLTPGATLRVGVASSGLGGGFTDTLQVDGTLGAPGSQANLELGTSCKLLRIYGTGNIQMGRFRPNNNNLNYPGGPNANGATGASVLIDKDMTLSVSGNYAFSATNSAPVNDSTSVTILAGRTVTITDPTSYFHNDLSSSGTANGKLVYNINGTLDLSANTSTTGGSKLIPWQNPASTITLNVNGLLKLGAYFKADTISTSQGAVFMNIGNGGLVDASLTTNLITGTVGATAASPNIYFVTSGTGALKRTAVSGGPGVKFPIGLSITNYNPITITNLSGPDETFTVGITNVPVVPPPAKTLPRAWGIVEGTPGGNTATVAFSFTTADLETPGPTAFEYPGQPVYVGVWDGAQWVTTAAAITGSGSPTDPYVATASGPIASTAYILTNTNTTPVFLVNMKASKQPGGIQIEFGNATEMDVKEYVIEKSADGINFVKLTTLLPKTNNGSLNSYVYTDANPYSGNNSYRIKTIEKGGSVEFSTVMSLSLSRTGTNVNVYPNPVKGNSISIQLENLDKAVYTVVMYNGVGQKVFTKQMKHDGNTSTLVTTLPPSAKTGIYRLQVTGGNKQFVRNIIVE